jgi:predicted amidophosphoribosyltransferase
LVKYNKIRSAYSSIYYSFAVKGLASYQNLLLIDDAVGSGATLNQIARKIKVKDIAKTIIGLAIVGSYKGFDVITDI